MSFIYSTYNPNKKLIFSNMLHVLSITKNFLSMAQFTKENNILMEFHADCVYMMDKNIG